jgi:hypothetical protein
MILGWVTIPVSLFVLMTAVAIVRLVELTTARRNTRWAIDRGGIEYGQRHHPVMITLHVCLLVGTIAEVAFTDRAFVPLIGWPALAVLILVQAGRTWCMRALGSRWNTPRHRRARATAGRHRALPLDATPQLPHRPVRRHRPAPRPHRMDYRHPLHHRQYALARRPRPHGERGAMACGGTSSAGQFVELFADLVDGPLLFALRVSYPHIVVSVDRRAGGHRGGALDRLRVDDRRRRLRVAPPRPPGTVPASVSCAVVNAEIGRCLAPAAPSSSVRPTIRSRATRLRGTGHSNAEMPAYTRPRPGS